MQRRYQNCLRFAELFASFDFAFEDAAMNQHIAKPALDNGMDFRGDAFATAQFSRNYSFSLVFRFHRKEAAPGYLDPDENKICIPRQGGIDHRVALLEVGDQMHRRTRMKNQSPSSGMH